MNWVKRFFYGRYGIDQLSMVVLIFGALVLIIARLIQIPAVSVVYWFCMFIFFYRTLSRDIPARQRENTQYFILTKRIAAWFRLRLRMIREVRTHIYIKCPFCAQRIRAPRGRGRILITCQKCGRQFEKKV